ncbi:winged helix-turn-helix transcriptional regulator [Chryseobacterium aquaticum]|uniref:Winged helix-turn-helix transcriptional regulator n=1 Tax=Chryseobacterium aquaticum TaxID=452084 RepID=A0A848N245_9FLAO|nr:MULTISPECIES: MarR family winged helix-turn-helix transcriptional regulator [Chryseobacterium]NMR32621.1 winged helix-turn-helix transcriptional regulator [Chryseobacterium aquaticum]NRQ45449.1 winged helix-turn-helix transcriptional regulator [Chryseobacterium sp. C-204]
MDFQIIKDILALLEEFNSKNINSFYPSTIEGFKSWISDQQSLKNSDNDDIHWEGKENGRSIESAITTLLVHLNRYAKNYSKSAISDSDFSTQEDFIYLINLKSFGEMSKIDLIKKNIHEKPVGNLIINRLLKQGWIDQKDSTKDKRIKIIYITEKGELALENQMKKIRQATQIISGNLNHSEKKELLRILTKLDDFHQPIYQKNIENKDLIETVNKNFSFENN